MPESVPPIANVSEIGPDAYLTLVREKLVMVTQLPQDFLDSVSVEVARNVLTDNIALRIKALVYGEVLPAHTVTDTVPVPASWWQHFKQDHAYRWWLRGFVRWRPVRTTDITLTTTWREMAAYPWAELRTLIPDDIDLGSAVRISLGSRSRLSVDPNV